MLLWLGWLALAQARSIGINFILSLVCLVWMADVAAYFGGRAFGRRKLAPSISPGKSWEGVWSGQVGVLLALASGLPALVAGRPYLSHYWGSLLEVKLSTVMLFDLGVFLAVWGALAGFIMALLAAREEAP